MATERAIRAARLVQHERPLEVTEIPLEDPADDEVVVEMEFAAVNPLDRYHALGRVAPELPLPRTLGVEGVGRVNGRRIALHGYGLGAVRPGLWAEAAVVPKVAGVELPAGVDPRMAAAMGVAGTTAWRTVTEVAGVKAHDRVLVLGASGGVGTMTVSLVKSLGRPSGARPRTPRRCTRSSGAAPTTCSCRPTPRRSARSWPTSRPRSSSTHSATGTRRQPSRPSRSTAGSSRSGRAPIRWASSLSAPCTARARRSSATAG